MNDLLNTSISLQRLFKVINKSRAKHIVLFLDSCHSGLPLDDTMRDLLSDLSEEELKEFFDAAESRICFSSCKTNETSRSNRNLKHGIWTYHLLEALKGNAPDSVAMDNIITPNSLQNYLSVAVKRTLKSTFSEIVVQTPWLAGGLSNEYPIADLGPILQAKKKALVPTIKHLKQAFFRKEELQSIKSLSGFKTGYHKVPTFTGNAVDRFVSNISESEVKEKIDEVLDSIRTHIGYKAKDIDVSTGEGGGTIFTPDFEYSLSVSINTEDLSTVLWREEISNISNPEMIMSDDFNEAFASNFDSILLVFKKDIDVRKFVELAEEEEGDGMSVDYPHDFEYCELKSSKSDFTIIIKENTIEFRNRSTTEPRKLVKGYVGFFKQLGPSPIVKMLPL